jgi:hypothetical protein
MTNALAISSIALTVISLLMASVLVVGAAPAELALGVASIIVTVLELVHRARATQSQPMPSGAGGPQFTFPWATGVFGGFFGGAIAAPVIAVAYHAVLVATREEMAKLGFPPPNEPRLFVEIAMASLAIGAVVGVLTLGFAALFEHLRKGAPLLTPLVNRLTGALAGGLIAGLICGPLGTLYFGLQPLPVLEPKLMLIGALPAAGLMTFSIVAYGNERIGWRTLTTLLLAMASVALVAAVVAVVLMAFTPEIIALIQHYIVPGTRSGLLHGGLYYGAFVGSALGAVVGLTLLMVRRL